MVVEGEAESIDSQEIPETKIKLPENLQLSKPVQNSITLDFCDYYFDGELQEKNGYVLNIVERANRLERPVQIHQDYYVEAEYIPEKLYLVCETPEIFEISINGNKIEKNIEGYFVDKSFKKIEISNYMTAGMNTISFDCDFKQSDKFYKDLRRAYKFETEKNKLAYDMEIEAIYLLGDFCVKTDGQWTDLNRNSSRYSGKFVICKPEPTINIKHIEKQGYPFFSGELELEGKIDIVGNNPVLILERKGINVVKIEINGKKKTLLTGYKIPLDQFEAKGKTKVKLTLVNNLRNLLGPHHLKEGETYFANPSSFFKESCVWNFSPEKDWDEDYCFVETSI